MSKLNKDAKYAFCESAMASLRSPWHIRQLTEQGSKFGGGADTKSLCDWKVAWDVDVEITEHHLSHCCESCKNRYVIANMDYAEHEVRVLALEALKDNKE